MSLKLKSAWLRWWWFPVLPRTAQASESKGQKTSSWVHSARKHQPFVGVLDWRARMCAPASSAEKKKQTNYDIKRSSLCNQRATLTASVQYALFTAHPRQAFRCLLSEKGGRKKESLTQQFWTSLTKMEMRGQGRKKYWESIQIERNKRKKEVSGNLSWVIRPFYLTWGEPVH